MVSHNNAAELNDFREFGLALSEHPPKTIHGIVLLALLLLGGAVTWTALTRAKLVVQGFGRVRPVSTSDEDGHFVNAEVHSQRSGQVVKVGVTLGQQLRKGDLIVQIDDRALRNQVAKLEKSTHTSQAELTDLKQSVELLRDQHAFAMKKSQAELEAAMAEAQTAEAHRKSEIALRKFALKKAEDRTHRLEQVKDAVPEEELFAARNRCLELKEELHKAQIPIHVQKVEILRKTLELEQRRFKVASHQLAMERRAKQGALEAANMDLENLQLEMEQTVLRAPADCIVTSSDVKAGDVLRPGKIGITLARRHGIEFEAIISNVDIAHLHPGLPVQIKLDAYDHHKYGTLSGKLALIAPDSDFQRGSGASYKIRIELHSGKVGKGIHHGTARLGMTGTAEIVTEQESVLRILLRNMRRRISFS